MPQRKLDVGLDSVKRLMRIREGSLRLGTLGTGKWRKLTPQEIAHLRREAGLS